MKNLLFSLHVCVHVSVSACVLVYACNVLKNTRTGTMYMPDSVQHKYTLYLVFII